MKYNKCMDFKVSIARGDEYKSTFTALKLIEDDIVSKLEKMKPQEIFLKPNWIKFRPDWLSITKLDTIRAIVDFFIKLGEFEFIVADATPTVFGWNGKSFLKQENYKILEKEYDNLVVLDLNDYPAREKFMAKTIDGDKPVAYYDPVLDAEFLVSIAKIKTHDTFANTLSLKNVAIGCAYWKDKIKFHAITKVGDVRENEPDKRIWFMKVLPIINYNFYKGSKTVYPDLAVIDGVHAMEGNGPVEGTPVDLGISLASCDGLSADIAATKIMGFELSEIPYLDILKDEMNPRIEVIGEDIDQFKYKFKPHSEYQFHKTTKEAVLKVISE